MEVARCRVSCCVRFTAMPSLAGTMIATMASRPNSMRGSSTCSFTA
ncbi:hypothetical protein ACFPRL_09135 [Pseudoclavibacter helvolus]